MSMLKRACLALPMFVLGVAAAQAATIFSFANFASCTGLQLNGDAACTSNVLRLTPAATGQSGSAFSTTQVQLGGGATFSTFFSFQMSASGGIGDGDGAGADGIVFVVQPVANNVGGAGGGIGYAGIPTSLGVEFDTFFNGGNDADGNHVGVDLNGSVVSVAAVAVAPRFNDGNVWFAWIDYDGTTLEIRVGQSPDRPLVPTLSYVVDLAAVLGTTQAFVGFTSGTGSGFANHDILTWQLNDVFEPIGVVSQTVQVPTLSTLALAALILLVALAGTLSRRGRAAR